MSALQFGKCIISPSIVFLQTKLCFAFTNRKPVLPGHILVSTRRVVSRFHDLTLEEVTDLFHCVYCITPYIQSHYNATGLTIAVQDGKSAGQTVEHVHVHVIPRKTGDFERNDDIYDELEHHDKQETGFRSQDQMSDEASTLKALLSKK